MGNKSEDHKKNNLGFDQSQRVTAASTAIAAETVRRKTVHGVYAATAIFSFQQDDLGT